MIASPASLLVVRLIAAVIAALLASAISHAQPKVGPAGQHDDALVACFDQLYSDPPQSIRTARSILASENLIVPARLRALNCLAASMAIQGNPDAARATIDEVLSTLRAADDLSDSEQTVNYRDAATTLSSIGDWATAMTLTELAYDKARQVDDVGMQIDAMLEIGAIQLNYLDDYPAAEDSMRRAIELASGNERLHPVMFYNLGYVLFRMQRYDEALTAYDEALAQTRRIPPGVPPLRMVEERIKAHRGATLHARGQSEQAGELLESALAAQQELPDAAGEAVTRTLLGQWLLDHGQADAALEHALVALDLARRAATTKEQREAMDLQSRALAASGRFDESLAAMRQAHEVQVNTLLEQGRRGVAQLQKQVRESDQLRETARSRQLGTLAATGIAIALLLGGIVAFSQYRTNRRLKRIALIDPLTGLLNRHEATRRLNRGIGVASPASTPARQALFLVDIDNLKATNDEHGPQAGDRVIASVAARLAACCRQDDIVARWGGEEFLIARECPDPASAGTMAEAMRHAVAERPLDLDAGKQVSVTVSIGFVPCPFFPADDDTPWQAGVPLADHALHAAANRVGGDAWIGIWGTASGIGTPLPLIRRSTDRAQVKGWIEITASRNVELDQLVLEDGAGKCLAARSLHDPVNP